MLLKSFLLFSIICFNTVPLAYSAGILSPRHQEDPFKNNDENLWILPGGYATFFLSVYFLSHSRRPKRIHQPRRAITSLAVSPDQKRIAFTTFDDISNSSLHILYLIDSNGENLVKIGKFPVRVTTFKSDSQNLILSRYTYDDESHRYISFDFYEVDINNAEKSFLFSLNNARNFSRQPLSPDNLKFLYFDYDDRILVYDIAQGKTIDTGVKGKSPAWSPDGKYIAYQGPDQNCYVMNSDMTGQELLWNTWGYRDKIFLSWSPDSQDILASRFEGGFFRWIAVQKNQRVMVRYIINRDSKRIRPKRIH